MDALDDPARSERLRALITRKAALRRFYLEAYGKYRACLLRCPREGLALELGSGAGFVKEVLPQVNSTPILRFAHHEPFDPDAVEWACPSSGPLSGANGALARIVFERDRPRFERLFPSLRLVSIEPQTKPMGLFQQPARASALQRLPPA